MSEPKKPGHFSVSEHGWRLLSDPRAELARLEREMVAGHPQSIALRGAVADAEELAKLVYRWDLDGLRRRLAEKPASAECLALLLADGRSSAVSEAASKSASAKNAAARAFVETSWAERSDKEQSKASFARAHLHLVKRRFGVDVTADTIARYWIPSA